MDKNITVGHGGKREGSGRPRKRPTVTIRVPAHLVKEIKELIKKFDQPNG